MENPSIGSSETEVLHTKRKRQENLLYVGLNAALVTSAVTLGFLGRYFELQFITANGYGAYTKLSFLVAYAIGLTFLDAWLVKNTIKGRTYEKILVLVVMSLFLSISLFIIIVNASSEIFVLSILSR